MDMMNRFVTTTAATSSRIQKVVVFIISLVISEKCFAFIADSCPATLLKTNNRNPYQSSAPVVVPVTKSRTKKSVLQQASSRSSDSTTSSRVCKARELMKSLVEDDKCFTSESGARAFGNVCAVNIVYEDCYEPQPVVGKTDVTNHMLQKVAQRQGRGDVRIDKISDGDIACGFAWTWTCNNEEGLRGTTFVELNDNGEIQYVREIPEPLFKPGEATLLLLKKVTEGAEFSPIEEYEKRTPTIANEIVKYLWLNVRGRDTDEGMRFFDENVIYRDFNFEDVLQGPVEVRKFIEDFTFPGIEFRPQRFDDGEMSSSFTWEVIIDGAPEGASIKGLSLYELNPATNKISYVRDVPESAIKPPILGKLARQLRPGLGVFQGVPLGSRPGGA